MKKLLAMLLVLVMALSLVACGGEEAKEEPKEEKKEDVKEETKDEAKDEEKDEAKDEEKDEDMDMPGKGKKVALILDVAATNPFLLDMINAVKDGAEKYGYEANIVECADTAAYEDNARALIEEGVDFLIGGGWQAGEPVSKMADEFPEKADYAVIDVTVESPNVKCISFREQEGAYLIGKMAALVTKEDDMTFGGVHVFEGPGSFKWRYGFMEGVKSVKPEAKFIFNYVGSFNDPAKSKEFAIQQFEQGCAFVNAASALGDSGVFEAALEKEFFTSGQDIDKTNPDNPFVISCQIKDTYASTEKLIADYFSKEWNTDNEVYGLEDGTIGAVHVTHESVNPMHEVFTEEVIGELKQAAEDIRTGKIDLSEMPEEADYEQ